MTFPELLDLFHAQYRKPWVWAIVVALTAAGFLGDVITSRSWNTHPPWWIGLYLLLCLLNMGTAVLLGPLGWLRSRASGAFPGIGRGLIQVVSFGLPCFALLTVLEWAMHAVHPRPHAVPGFGRLFLFSLPSFSVVFCLGGFGIAAYEREFIARNEAERRAREAQWILLKGQMNPDVLFNVLNNLVELIRKDASRAEEGVMHLSDLFRRFREQGKGHLLPLRDERLLVERYLSLESLRLGDRLQVDWDWEDALDGVMAPPFLVQPLVENAIRHALAPHPPGGRLRISGEMGKGEVRLRVGNTGRPMGPRHNEGRGLDNLEARLRMAFEEEGRLTLASEAGWTEACLRFPVLVEGL